MKMERWNGSFNLDDALNFNENSTGYAGTTWLDGASKSWPTETSPFIARFTGFLVPPETDYYNLYIRGEDSYMLYFNETGDPAGKVKYVKNLLICNVGHNSFLRLPDHEFHS